nr:phosphate ABC transporter permease PstA [Actinomycetota bacterium]
ASATATDPTTAAVERALHGRRADWRGIAFQGALVSTLVTALVILTVLIGDVVRKGMPVFRERGSDFITGDLSSFAFRAGVWQGIVGSLSMMIFVVLLAFPLGIGAAVYIEEYARDTHLTRFINANIRNLAGVPSIVYGLLGLAIFVKALGSITGPRVSGRSLISAGLTLAVMVLPIVIITSAEALRSVPRSIREAGYGVGATRWEVIRSHVLPYAAPGILTGTVLSLARAMGETAPLILVGATTGFLGSNASFFQSFQERFTALPIIIFRWASLPDERFRALTAAAIMVLLTVLLLMNSVAIVLRNRYDRKW